MRLKHIAHYICSLFIVEFYRYVALNINIITIISFPCLRLSVTCYGLMPSSVVLNIYSLLVENKFTYQDVQRTWLPAVRYILLSEWHHLFGIQFLHFVYISSTIQTNFVCHSAHEFNFCSLDSAGISFVYCPSFAAVVMLSPCWHIVQVSLRRFHFHLICILSKFAYWPSITAGDFIFIPFIYCPSFAAVVILSPCSHIDQVSLREIPFSSHLYIVQVSLPWLCCHPVGILTKFHCGRFHFHPICILSKFRCRGYALTLLAYWPSFTAGDSIFIPFVYCPSFAAVVMLSPCWHIDQVSLRRFHFHPIYILSKFRCRGSAVITFACCPTFTTVIPLSRPLRIVQLSLLWFWFHAVYI
jgi:hypothetical protein